jgi:dTDP-glucose 4,6-dehydratase/UDP-glucose 4-epimerase
MHDAIRADLDAILGRKPEIWDGLRGRSIFLTGGTGWFGRWLLESIRHANMQLDAGIRVTVLSRDPSALARAAPHLVADPAMRFHVGDVRDFVFPKGEFSHVIHAATTSARETYQGATPLSKFDTLVDGTRRILDFCTQCGVERFLFLSSGVAYGVQPTRIDRIPETYSGAPDTTDVNSALGQAKRSAEFLCAYYAHRHDWACCIARCFSFVGPFLPLDIHYAIGNFIGQALGAEAITVNGDGRPERSYLYLADLVVWLLAALLAGGNGRIYNIGSDRAISIGDLANLVRDIVCPDKTVRVLGQTNLSIGNTPRDRYVPDIGRAREELGLDVWTALPDAIRRSAAHASSFSDMPTGVGK